MNDIRWISQIVTFEKYHQNGGTRLLVWYAADSTKPLCNNRVKTVSSKGMILEFRGDIGRYLSYKNFFERDQFSSSKSDREAKGKGFPLQWIWGIGYSIREKRRKGWKWDTPLKHSPSIENRRYSVF